MNNTQNPNSIPDLNQTSSDIIQETIKSLQTTLVAWNYSFLGTPLLEPAEIFLRKSGEAFTWETYNLTDSRGQRFALRPEFTSSVARHILQSENQNTFPIRKCYAGPVFRNDATNRQQSQFNQVGAELVGLGSIAADAEVVALAISSLRDSGYTKLELKLGNVGVASNLLEQFGLSQRTISLLLSRLDWLTDVEQHADEIQLQIGRSQRLPSITDSPNEPEAEQGEAILLSLLSTNDDQVTGSRSLDEIVQRYMKRVGAYQNLQQTQLALEFLAEFTAIRGTLGQASQKAQTLATKWQLDPTSLTWITDFSAALAHYSLDDVPVTCDFSLTHDVRYYTGMVFEVLVPYPETAGQIPVCSGGRYDMLYRSLGASKDTPALGFALSVEALVSAHQESSNDRRDDPFKSMGILVLPANSLAIQSALQHAARIRSSGERAGFLASTDSVPDLYEYARANMMSRIEWIGQDGIEKEQILDK